MRAPISRRRFLKSTAAGLSTIAMADIARAQLATQSPPKRGTREEFSVTTPVSIEVNARPLASFDTRDRSHVRFGSLEYRSGLILTSRFRGFGGLSGLRLDAKGERFIAISDVGTWFTGRIVYRGREMTGLDDVEAAPMLGPDGRPITARGWFDSEFIALDGPLVYIGLERVNQVLRFDFSKGFTRARGEVVSLPPAARKLPYNKGLEALVMVPKSLPLAGTLIAISECGLDADGNLIAFLRSGALCRASSAFAVPIISTSATRCCCARAISCCWSARFRGSKASASESGASRSNRWRRAPWSMALRSSMQIWATRSTTWRGSMPTSPRRATPC